MKFVILKGGDSVAPLRGRGWGWVGEPLMLPPTPTPPLNGEGSEGAGAVGHGGFILPDVIPAEAGTYPEMQPQPQGV